jgi:hypothetical protein
VSNDKLLEIKETLDKYVTARGSEYFGVRIHLDINAPEWLDWLISQLEQAQAENERLKTNQKKLIESIKSKIDVIDQRIARMSKHDPIHCDHSERISGLDGEAYMWERCLELIESIK